MSKRGSNTPPEGMGTVGEAVVTLIAKNEDKNAPGSGQNGRYAQHNAAEKEAWGAAYHYGLDTEIGKTWGQVASLIADQYHACKWLIAA